MSYVEEADSENLENFTGWLGLNFVGLLKLRPSGIFLQLKVQAPKQIIKILVVLMHIVFLFYFIVRSHDREGIVTFPFYGRLLSMD